MDKDTHSLLIVEDDAATAAYLADNLAADGFRVATASSAGEALRAIEVRRPDLVLLDLALESSSGLAVLDGVRGADGLASRIDPELPVLVLSGRGSETDRARGFERGADDYVVKPSTSVVASCGGASRGSSGTPSWVSSSRSGRRRGISVAPSSRTTTVKDSK